MGDTYEDIYSDTYGTTGDLQDSYSDIYLDTYGTPSESPIHDVEPLLFEAVASDAPGAELEPGDGEAFTGTATGALTASPEVEPTGITTEAGATGYGAAGGLSVGAPTVEGPGGQDINVGTLLFSASGRTYAQPERLRRSPGRRLLAAPSVAVHNALEASQIEVWRVIDILNADETLWATEVGFSEGRVSVDMTRDERRTIDLTLDNFDRSLSPKPDGFWYDKIIRARRGVVVDDVRYEFDLGYFMIDQISRASDIAVSISGRDYAKKMINDKLEAAVTFKSGTKVMDIISSVAYNSGITRVDLPASDLKLATDLTFDADTARWEIAKEVALAYGFDLYFSASGTLTARTQVDPVTTPPTFVLGESAGNTIDLTPSTNDGQLYNHVVVISSSGDDTLPVWASVENNEPSSPTRINKIGRRTKRIESALATTKEQCLEMAKNFLRVSGLEQFDMGFSSLNYPWLDVGAIVEVDDPEAARTDPRRYLLGSLEVPMQVGAMSGSCKRVTIVGSTATTSPEFSAVGDVIWGDEGTGGLIVEDEVAA
jgi:hypothetical protein